jgi:hypothetical protein
MILPAPPQSLTPQHGVCLSNGASILKLLLLSMRPCQSHLSPFHLPSFARGGIHQRSYVEMASINHIQTKQLAVLLAKSTMLTVLAIPTTTQVGLARTVYIYTPYMTVYLVNFLPKIPYIHRTYVVLANPTHRHTQSVLTHGEEETQCIDSWCIDSWCVDSWCIDSWCVDSWCGGYSAC